jgi:hypothetical protein
LIEAANPDALIADKAFDADPFIATLTLREITPVIPPKANRKTQRLCEMANARLYESGGSLTETLNTGRNQHEAKESGDIYLTMR